jgi:hypothetical protein
MSRSTKEPPEFLRCGDSAQRFRGRAAFGVRPLCWRFSDHRTAAGELLLAPHSTPDPMHCCPTTFTLRCLASSLARGWVHLRRRPRPADSQAPPAKLLSPLAAAGVARGTGRGPKPAPESVGSPPKGAIEFSNNPPHLGALCRSEPWERRGTARFCGPCSPGGSKGEMRPVGRLAAVAQGFGATIRQLP